MRTALGVYTQSGSAWVKASDLLSVHAWELRFCGRDALWLEETIWSTTWKSWPWHSLVAVGEVLSVRSQGGFVTDKPS